MARKQSASTANYRVWRSERGTRQHYVCHSYLKGSELTLWVAPSVRSVIRRSGTRASICPTAPSTSARRSTRLPLSRTNASARSWSTLPNSRAAPHVPLRQGTAPTRPEEPHFQARIDPADSNLYPIERRLSCSPSSDISNWRNS